MNGYSKMKIVSDNKSRSIDFSSDLFSSSPSLSENRNPKLEIPKTNLEELIKSNPLTKTNTTTTTNNKSRNKTRDSFSFSEQEEEEEEEEDQVSSFNYINNNNNGEKFGNHIKLSRNSTVSASSAVSHALQSTVKRAFSVKRSSSVSERYSRIHDQSVTVASPIEDEDLADKKKKKKSSKSKIVKACKKLFGF